MKRALVIDNNYPNKDNKYGDVFVHVRVKEYQKKLDVSIVGLNRKLPESYIYEGVSVRNFSDRKSFIEYIISYKPDVLLIHFLDYWMIDSIVLRMKIPTIIWVHGHEVIKWYRRLFNFSLSLSFFRYALRTEIQSAYWNRFIHYANNDSRIHFVFVSLWMKEIAEKDSCAKIKSFSIIPNRLTLICSLFQIKTVNCERESFCCVPLILENMQMTSPLRQFLNYLDSDNLKKCSSVYMEREKISIL